MTSVILIDLAHIFWSAWHAMAAQELNGAYNVTIAKCREAMTEWRGVPGGYDAIAWCVDAPPYKRLSIRADYKAQREKPDPRAIDQYRRIQDWLKAQGELVWKCQGYEADDIIATACAQAPEDVEVIDIYSSDKDLLQLVTDRVNVLPARSDASVTRYDPATILEKHGVTPAQFGEYLAICGDKADNIPGVKGWGPKKASHYLNTVGNIDAILKAASDIGDKRFTPSLRTMLNNALGELNDSRRLVALMTDAPIRFEELWEPRERHDVEPPPEDRDDAGGEPQSDEAPPEDDAPPEIGKAPEASQPAAAPETDPSPESSERPAEPEPAPKAKEAPKGSGATGATGSNGKPPTNGEPPDEENQRPVAPAAKPASVSVERAEFALTYEPNSRKVAWWLAEKAVQSHVFPGINNPAQGYIILQVGRELGLTAMASLRGIKMVKGQPMIMSTLLVGIILQSGLAEYFRCVETTTKRAVYVTKRKGQPQQTIDYTIEEAEACGLLRPSKEGEPSNYVKRPKTMLRHRCAAELARMEYPEIASGVYVFGEDLGDGVIDVEGMEMAS